MNRPEKKTEIHLRDALCESAYLEAYNQACDEWEKFLPSEEEIGDVVTKWFFKDQEKDYTETGKHIFKASLNDLAKAISERLK